MTNLGKYLPEIIGEELCIKIAHLRNAECTNEENCDKCIKDNIKWLKKDVNQMKLNKKKKEQKKPTYGSDPICYFRINGVCYLDLSDSFDEEVDSSYCIYCQYNDEAMKKDFTIKK